ncbi:glycosyltransferase [Micromonospora sp. NPDC050495]|uniref:glycosyltransferase n=1 Tax=Micromonospora sp. NPDC050495 TaxID=3154936 RepID=UPI0033FA49B3
MTTQPRRRPRVLYLSFYFPPSRASGVYRARATANHLAAHDWDVTVFAAPMRFLHDVAGSVDEGLAATVDPRIRVERPELNYFKWEHDLRRFSRLRRTMPLVSRKLYEAGQRIFPEHYLSWGRSAVAKALRLHARRRFDVVLATGNPFASFAAAWMINRITGLPYVVDYRDSWTLDLFADKPGFPEGHPVWGWERRVLERASAASFVNEALRGWHAERYPAVADRMMVVPNGWDPDLLTDVGDGPGDGHAGPAAPLRFSYVGTLTAAQPVEQMTTAFQLARRHPELADAELNIYGHLGFFASSQELMRERLGLTDEPGGGVHYRGPVAKTEISQAYADSDVLVFLAGGAKYVTSGKVFEYMASGRPIVSVHAPGIAATEVLQGYPLWFNADSLDPEQIAQSMMAAGKAARDLDPELRAAARRHAQAYTRERVLVPLEAKLRSLTRFAVTPDRQR